MIAIALLGAAAKCFGADEAQVRPPNIVFILADDLGLECVTAYGGQSHSTPNIDRLAAEGMMFSHCFSAPACSPTRAQLLTGLHPFAHGIKHIIYDPKKHRAFLSPTKFTSFASLLKKKGYATGFAGKWQLSLLQEHDTIGGFGFDEYCAWQIFAGEKKTSRHCNPTFRKNGKVVKYSGGEYGPDLLCDFSLDFIRRNRDKPFCLYYCGLLPHFPLVPTPNSADQTMPKARDGETRFFPDMVTHLDQIVGRITREIDRLGLANDTIIIFSGDNGTDRRLKSRYQDRVVPGGKATMKDTGVRVPLIVRQPGRIKKGSRSSALVDFSDILPTFCELADIAVPASAQGRSFQKLFDHPTERHRRWVFYEFLGKQAVRDEHATLVTGEEAKLNGKLGMTPSLASADDQHRLEAILRQVTKRPEVPPTAPKPTSKRDMNR